MKATNLKELIAELRNMTPAELERVDMTSLPTFGGEEPANMTGVWSWDETSFLVGDDIGSGEFVGDLKIISRVDA